MRLHARRGGERSAVLRYTAFDVDGEGGNPAGVVLDARGMDDTRMQEIAAEVGFSETAFLTSDESPDERSFQIRYFSPVAGSASTISRMASVLRKPASRMSGILLCTDKQGLQRIHCEINKETAISNEDRLLVRYEAAHQMDVRFPRVDIHASSAARPQSARRRQAALRSQDGSRSSCAPVTRKDLGKISLGGRFTPLSRGKSTGIGKLSAKC